MQIYLLLPQAPGARNVGRHYRATTVQGPAALRRADGRTHAQRRTVRFQAGQLAESKAHATVHPRLQMQVAGHWSIVGACSWVARRAGRRRRTSSKPPCQREPRLWPWRGGECGRRERKAVDGGDGWTRPGCFLRGGSRQQHAYQSERR